MRGSGQIDYRRVVNPSRQVRTFRDLSLITELLDSKAESDDVGFGAELAWMSCQIERAFRFVEVLKKADFGLQTPPTTMVNHY